MTIEELFGTLQMSVVSGWRKHLRTAKYAKHEALDEFYKEMPEKVDALIEAWMGAHGKKVGSFQNTLSASNMNTLKYLGELKRVCKEGYALMGDKDELKSLLDDGKMLGIATSKPEDTANRVLEYFDLKKYFKVICAAPLNGLNGEKAGRIRAAIEEARALGCAAKNPVLVGDTKFDVLGAHECNIPCIGVTWGFAKEGEFEACNTEFIVDTMEKLLNLLK